jgi:excisionase family DNA binding protein
MEYTPKQAAAALGVSDETIYRMIRSGIMQATKRGAFLRKPRYIISEDELERIRREGNYGELRGNDHGLAVAA